MSIVETVRTPKEAVIEAARKGRAGRPGVSDVVFDPESEDAVLDFVKQHPWMLRGVQNLFANTDDEECKEATKFDIISIFRVVSTTIKQ